MSYTNPTWLLAALTLLCSVFATAGQAQAQDDERARVHYEAGTSYFSEGDYETALREFNRSYALSQRAVLLYNIALCHERLGDFPAAVENLRRFLVEVPDAPNRDVVQRRLTHMEERLARQAAASNGTPDETPDDPPMELPPAEVVGPDGSIPADAVDQRIGGDDASAPVEPDEPPPSSGPPVAALASFIAGGVGVVTFAVFGGLAVSENGSLDSSCSPACANTDTLDTYALVADIGLGIAVVGGVLGVVFLLTGGDEGDSDDASASITPWADPSGGGVVARGTF